IIRVDIGSARNRALLRKCLTVHVGATRRSGYTGVTVLQASRWPRHNRAGARLTIPGDCCRARVSGGDGAAMTATKGVAVRTGAALCSIWLAGCVISPPQTAAEFRSAVASAQTATKETFEVDRPLAQVGASFQRLASECLSKTIRMTEHQPGVSYMVVTSTYKP